jgi:hypothetical protein
LVTGSALKVTVLAVRGRVSEAECVEGIKGVFSLIIWGSIVLLRGDRKSGDCL